MTEHKGLAEDTAIALPNLVNFVFSEINVLILQGHSTTLAHATMGTVFSSVRITLEC